MNMETLLGDELNGSIKKIRTSTDNYEELVFLAEKSSNLHEMLTEKLGVVIKNGSDKSETGMLETAIEIANSNGGIDDDQFLYGGVVDSTKIVIMIWPWQDNEHLTVKKFIIK